MGMYDINFGSEFLLDDHLKKNARTLQFEKKTSKGSINSQRCWLSISRRYCFILYKNVFGSRFHFLLHIYIRTFTHVLPQGTFFDNHVCEMVNSLS